MADSPHPDSRDNTLYLIDGHAQIFRSYYAIAGGRGGMTSPVTGEPTHAVFAFAGMMLKLFDQMKPRYVAMAIDSGGSTVREALYPEYKANREAPPEDFEPQVQRILEMVRLFDIPILVKEGVEADDLIATVVRRLCGGATEEPPALRAGAKRVAQERREDELHIRIVSRDKDLEQLLSPCVSLYDIHTDTTIDTAALARDKGITPAQVVDLLTLTGDKVDNIPGVEGVGTKTAAKLIQAFGSVQGVLDHLDQIKGKRRENIEKASEHLARSRQLVTLMDDIDFDFDLAGAKVGEVDVAGLKRLFRELGFRRHITDLERIFGAAPVGEGGKSAKPQAADSLFGGGLFDAVMEDMAAEAATPGVATPAAMPSHYQLITTRAKLDEVIATLRERPIFAIDTETAGLGWRTGLCGISLSWEAGQGVYVPVCSPTMAEHLDKQTVLDALRPVLEDAALAKCGHNIKYDMLVLRHEGVRLRGTAFDSMIGAALMSLPGHGMDALSLSLLKHETIPLSDLIDDKGRDGKPRSVADVALASIAPYAAEDADITLRLYEYMRPRLSAMGVAKLNDEVETPLIEVLADMEFAGIRVDPAELEAQKDRLRARADELRDQILEAAGCEFNPDSPKQLADVLFNKLQLPVIKRRKTGPSTDVEVLERLAERECEDDNQTRLPRLMLEYRELTKLLGTYLDALGHAINETTHRVHTNFNQVAAATGRLSSNDPNLQNIPIRTPTGRQIRKAFVAEAGHKLICADYSQVELRVLAHLSGDEALTQAFKEDRDIHAAVAAEVFGVEEGDITSEQRGHAKVVNFGIIYGVTPYGLARRIEGLDVNAAKKLIDDYRTRFSGIDRFLEACVAQAQKRGYVTTILGRRRAITQLEARNRQTKALGERLAINSVVQGSAADLIKLAMVNLYRRIEREKLPLRMLLQIHDELVCEAPEVEADRCAAIVREEMEQAMTLDVPLRVEAGIASDWFSAKG